MVIDDNSCDMSLCSVGRTFKILNKVCSRTQGAYCGFCLDGLDKMLFGMVLCMKFFLVTMIRELVYKHQVLGNPKFLMLP